MSESLFVVRAVSDVVWMRLRVLNYVLHNEALVERPETKSVVATLSRNVEITSSLYRKR